MILMALKFFYSHKPEPWESIHWVFWKHKMTQFLTPLTIVGIITSSFSCKRKILSWKCFREDNDVRSSLMSSTVCLTKEKTGYALSWSWDQVESSRQKKQRGRLYLIYSLILGHNLLHTTYSLKNISIISCIIFYFPQFWKNIQKKKKIRK